jgi:hypothetical protein
MKLNKNQKFLLVGAVVVLVLLTVVSLPGSLETSLLQAQCQVSEEIMTAAVPEPDTVAQNCSSLEYVWTYGVDRGGEFNLSFLLEDGVEVGEGYFDVVPQDFPDVWGIQEDVAWFKSSSDALMTVNVDESTAYRFKVLESERKSYDVIVNLVVE